MKASLSKTDNCGFEPDSTCWGRITGINSYDFKWIIINTEKMIAVRVFILLSIEGLLLSSFIGRDADKEPNEITNKFPTIEEQEARMSGEQVKSSKVCKNPPVSI